jgi:hypothetical protein
METEDCYVGDEVAKLFDPAAVILFLTGISLEIPLREVGNGLQGHG